jgi:hypothetical protein
VSSTLNNRAAVLAAHLEDRMWRAVLTSRAELQVHHPRHPKPIGVIDLKTLRVELRKGFETFRPGLEHIVAASQAARCP